MKNCTTEKAPVFQHPVSGLGFRDWCRFGCLAENGGQFRLEPGDLFLEIGGLA
jgi:hypothetical protein